MDVAAGEPGAAQGGIVHVPHRPLGVEESAKLEHVVERDAREQQPHDDGLAPGTGVREFALEPCDVVQHIVCLLDRIDLMQIG